MRTLYYSGFNTTAEAGAPLQQDPNNGQVVQSGTALRIVCPSGSDCTWWSSDYDAPHAQVLDGIGYLVNAEWSVPTSGVVYVASGIVGSGQLTGGGAGVLWGECRLTAVASGVDDEPKSGIMLYQNEANVWQLGYNHLYHNLSLQKIVSGTGTTVTTTTVSGINDPNVAPLRLRLYVNTHPSRSILNDRNTVMAPGQVAAYYSDTDGVLWTQVSSSQSAGINVDAVGFGVFTKRSIAAPVTEAWADFDSLRIAINEAHELFWASGARNTETGAWEDGLTYWYNPQTEFTTESGILDKKLARMPSSQENYQAVGAVEDDYYYAFDRLIYPSQRNAVSNDFGGVSAWEDSHSYNQTLQRNPGQLYDDDNNFQAKQAVEDALSLTWDPTATWADGIVDGEGREFVDGYSVQAMYYYDSTADDFYTVPSGFYGAAADGYWYYDGRRTSFTEDFCTIASGVPQASWGDHSNPMAAFWPGHLSYYNITIIADNEMRIQTTQPLTSWQAAGIAPFGRWYLEGDFDIQISYKNLSKSGGSAGALEFDIYRDNYHRIFISREWDNYISSNFQNEGSWVSHTDYFTTQTSGRFRYTRTGSTVRAYRDNGAGWAQVGADRAFGTWACYVGAWVAGTGNLNYDVRIYDLKLNSGSANSRAGWYREGDGSHFGSRKTFPEHSWIVAGNNSLNIIDADNNKLWMRFVAGSNYGYQNSGSQGIKAVKMKEGVLWAACAGTATGGHALRIDFTKEDVRYISSDSGNTFARLKWQSGSQNTGYWSSIGGIRNRNGADGWNGGFSNWTLPGGSCFGVDFMFEGTNKWNERVAIATNAGIKVCDYNKNYWMQSGGADYPSNTNTVETDPCMWCYFDESNGDLYWLTRNAFRKASRATYFAGFGGTFTHDSEILLPRGRLGRWEQYRMVRYGGYFYLPSKVGVWRITGTTGTWELALGKPGSGALSEIITRTGNQPISIALTQVAGVDLIMVCIENERDGWCQVILVRASDLTLYGKSQLIIGRTGQPKALAG